MQGQTYTSNGTHGTNGKVEQMELMEISGIPNNSKGSYNNDCTNFFKGKLCTSPGRPHRKLFIACLLPSGIRNARRVAEAKRGKRGKG